MSFDTDLKDFSSTSNLKYQMKRVLSKIRQEFSSHLESINENTNEIQANYEYIAELDNKVEKIREKLEEIQMFLKNTSNFQVEEGTLKYKIQPLSVNEKRVFIVLYLSPSIITYNDISHVLNISESLARSYITNIIEKGVPVVKKYSSGKPYLSLDEKFKKAQTDHNIIKIQQKQLSNF